jgi:threonylcarbamoyladenosine tRNA methylthiotransferase MtaB
VKIAMETLGCKLNQAETESLVWEFVAGGWEVVSDVREADIYVLNTCTVTATADAKARHRLRMAHRQNPEAIIAAAGCYAQRDTARLSSLDGVSLVVTNEDKPRLLEIVSEYIDRTSTTTIPSNTPSRVPPSLRTRAFIKVQEGCNGACAFCIVPRLRQGQDSVPANRVIAAIQARLSHAIKEIVITGTEVGSYCDEGRDLSGLLELVLAETKVQRLRLSSLQPDEVSRSLLSLWRDNRLCPHFHMSLQSGSDRILRAMRRRYSRQQYLQAAKEIRATVPDVALTTDVIVGFPGETDALFEETLETCRELGFARIHVFPFSRRPGTEAATMNDHVDDETKRRRVARMLSLAEESVKQFRESFKGRVRQVLWERRNRKGEWSGFTDNYLPVSCRSDDDLQSQIRPFMME